MLPYLLWCADTAVIARSSYHAIVNVTFESIKGIILALSTQLHVHITSIPCHPRNLQSLDIENKKLPEWNRDTSAFSCLQITFVMFKS